jgi:hypothetical protein
LSPIILLARLHREGFQLRADDEGRLVVCPRAKITDELRVLIRAHKVALLDLIEGKPTTAELDLLVAILDGSIAIQGIKVGPAGPRSIGLYERCPKHPQVGTWVRYGDSPACRRCELGIAPEPALTAPAWLSAWFVRHCQRRGLDRRDPRPRLAVPLAEQIAAALANGPKPARQLALELDVPLAEIVQELGDRAVAETDTGRRTHFADPDDEIHDQEGDWRWR